MNNVINIKKGKFSSDVQKELEIIYEYFNEFKLQVEENEESYSIELQRKDYSYCEDISMGVSELGVSDVNNSFFYNDFCGICFSENWLPYIYSQIKRNESDKISILHFDDHSDLMSPYISKKDGLFFDMITGKLIDFDNATTIYKCIESGAITIGSMLTGILYTTKNDIDIFHIKRNGDDFFGSYCKAEVSDSFFEQEVDRISVDIFEGLNLSGHGRYVRSSILSSIEKNLFNESDIILHIDMDYFNNRYNGSSDWETEWNSDDLNLDAQICLIDEMCDFISRNGIEKRIKNVLIGISPSFYPAEYWRKGLLLLVSKLCDVGVDLKNIKEKIKAGVLFEKTEI